MDDFTLARILHIVAVVFWIGGVGFVTLVVMPMLTETEPPDVRLKRFRQLESRFVWQARLWVIVTGATGFWMTWKADFWSRFEDIWWMQGMVVVWAIFALMLFIAEPLHLHRRMSHSVDPARDFVRMVRLHRVLLTLSIIVVIGAVGGSHGLF
ncbi:MAG: hypothetical protein RIM72_16450 [Alphaproteobacteria bacterium]